MSIGHDGDLGHLRSRHAYTSLGEADTMEVEEPLWTLRLTGSTPTRTLWFLNLRTLSHKVDGVFSRQTLDSWHILNIHLSCTSVISSDIENGDFIAFPRIIETDVNLKGPIPTRCQIQAEHRAIASLRSLESLQALCALSQTTKAEILKTYDSTVGDTRQIHRVIPDVVVILHPLVAVRTTCHIAGNTRRVILIGRKSEDLEALRGHFGTSIGHSIGGFGRPLVIFRVGIIARDLHHTTISHLLLIPCDLHRSHHGLTGKAEATRRTMVKHIPLAIDLLQ